MNAALAYRYHRAKAEAQPAAALVRTASQAYRDPGTPAKLAQLEEALYRLALDAYREQLIEEAAKLAIRLEGSVSDPAVLAHLRDLAHEHAGLMSQSYARQLAHLKARRAKSEAAPHAPADAPARAKQAELGLLRAHRIRRTGFRYLTGIVVQVALMDWYEHNNLYGPTAHCEPRDAALPDMCQDAIDLQSIPISQITIALPAHPECPHLWVADVPDETLFNGTLQVTTSSSVQLRGAGFWTGGMVIGSAGGD